jgi:hypothetical protein
MNELLHDVIRLTQATGAAHGKAVEPVDVDAVEAILGAEGTTDLVYVVVDDNQVRVSHMTSVHVIKAQATFSDNMPAGVIAPVVSLGLGLF